MRFLERRRCHLCEDAWAVLAGVSTTEGVERVDIDEDDALVVEYGLRIPVLLSDDGTVIAEGRFDADALRAAIGS
jgi:cytochrome c-type biogenesis protein CcmE